MIRPYTDSDLESMLTIWLEASIKAHDFIPPTYWQSKLDDMRSIYLPASDNYVYEDKGDVVGFISIYEQSIAALFVSPEQQGQGIGSQLLEFIKEKYSDLSLTVYKANTASISFYKKHGFIEVKEQVDPHTGHPEILMTISNQNETQAT